jgi:glycosyltransferase involved in cell wall biosynthesis
MHVSTPTISAAIPARNARETLTAAVQSALSQPGLVQVLLVDDGANGSLPKELAAGSHGRSRVIPGPQSGSGAARNAVIVACEREWVAFLDADDLWCDDHVEKLRALISGHRHAGAAFGEPCTSTPTGS